MTIKRFFFLNVFLSFPLGKMLMIGSMFHLSLTSTTLAACLSVQSVFTARAQRDPQCADHVRGLLSPHGDPFTLLAAYKVRDISSINVFKQQLNYMI